MALVTDSDTVRCKQRDEGTLLCINLNVEEMWVELPELSCYREERVFYLRMELIEKEWKSSERNHVLVT